MNFVLILPFLGNKQMTQSPEKEEAAEWLS